MICDFCSISNPTWAYPAKDFVVWEESGFVGESVGLWAACDECHDLIEAGDEMGLHVRSVDGYFANSPWSTVGPLSREDMARALRDIQIKFFKHRDGPARRVE